MEDVLKKIHALLEPLLEDTDLFIVSLKIKPINNIKIFLDADSGLSIEKCVAVNRKLHAQMEAEQMFPDGDDIEGMLKEVNDDRLVLEVKILKKKETTTVEIPFTDIKKIVVQIIF